MYALDSIYKGIEGPLFAVVVFDFTEHLRSPQTLLDQLPKAANGEAPPFCWWSPQQRSQQPRWE